METSNRIPDRSQLKFVSARVDYILSNKAIKKTIISTSYQCEVELIWVNDLDHKFKFIFHYDYLIFYDVQLKPINMSLMSYQYRAINM